LVKDSRLLRTTLVVRKGMMGDDEGGQLDFGRFGVRNIKTKDEERKSGFNSNW
jgi:hypothetical protein